MMELVKASLWRTKPGTVTRSIYEEMEKHAIACLPAPILHSLEIPEDLRKDWEQRILKQASDYLRYKYQQEHLPIGVPYVILKGTAAGQYYPYPEYRAYGDIDIMPRREDFSIVCEMLLANGWAEVTPCETIERGRHRIFRKGSFILENHAFFASMNDPEQAKALDDLIVDNISESHLLPDLINGLTLIEHINQHLENGLGLRQIIDWMMFVDRCLPDEKCPVFLDMARDTGMEKLAVITTRMCEKYLGLKEHAWAAGADEKSCDELMAYVLASGNFGKKLDTDLQNAISRMGRFRHPIRMIRELQTMGTENWEKASKAVFRPFAWLWQGNRVLKESRGLLLRGYYKGKRRRAMFDALGIKRSEKGLVFYEEGKYFLKKDKKKGM